MKDKRKKDIDELRPEYDFDYLKAVRGKYYQRLLEEGSNVPAVTRIAERRKMRHEGRYRGGSLCLLRKVS